MPALISTSPPVQTTSKMSTKIDVPSFNPRQTSCTAIYSGILPSDFVLLSPDLLRDLYGETSSSLSTESEEQERYIVMHGINQAQATSKKWTLYRVGASPGPSIPPHTCLLSNYNKFTGGPPSNSRVLIQAVSPVNLEQVLLVCPPESYEHVKSLSHEDAIQEFLGNADSRIIRQGDYNSTFNGIFKLCEPVDQGILNKNTKFTIVKGLTRIEDTEKDFDSQNNYDDIEVEIANYLDFNSLSLTQDGVQVIMEIQPLAEPISAPSIIPPPQPKDDPESRGFVRFEKLASIGCFSGDVVSTLKLLFCY